MLIKQTAIDQITITENGTILYREKVSLVEDSLEIASTFHRTSLVPGQDTQTLPEKVKIVCEAVWTPQVIEEYKKSLKKE